MRKHFLNTAAIALEAAAAAEAESSSNISMEEEQILMTEAAEDQAAVTTDLAEAERIVEVSDALEDLAVIADEITEASPTDIALIENAGEMAVAGSDVAPEEIVPALESFKGGKIATEGIREKAKSIWESIQKFLAQVWERIEAFFYKIFGTIPAKRRRLEAMKAQIAAAEGYTSEVKDIEIKSGLQALTVGGSVIRNEAELAKGLSATADAAKYVFGPYLDAVCSRGELIAKAIGDFDAAKPAEAADALRTKLKATHFPAVPGAKAETTGRYPGFKSALGAGILGNLQLVTKVYDDNKDDASTLGSFDRYRRSGVELNAVEGGGVKNAPAKVSTMSLGGMKSALADAEKLLDVLEEYKRGARQGAIKKVKQGLATASAKATAAMAAAPKDDAAAESVAVPYYRALLNFNMAHARWVQSPAMATLSAGITGVNATLVVVQKSLATYKAPAAK